MALLIPRLEWDDQSATATRTSGNPILSAISSTTAINVGMIAKGTGIPLDAQVISKTVNSVTLNVNATSSGSSVVEFFERYDFEFPPVKDTEEKLKPKLSVSESLSGTQQFILNFIEAERDLEFFFITHTDAEKLREKFYRFALLGNSFRYFDDKDDAPFKTMTLGKFDYSQNRQVKKHPYFKYSIQFSFRRVVT